MPGVEAGQSHVKEDLVAVRRTLPSEQGIHFWTVTLDGLCFSATAMTREGFVRPLLLPLAQGCEDSMTGGCRRGGRR